MKKFGAIPSVNDPNWQANPQNKGSGDIICIYMREMGETPLLTPQEEIALAKKIKRGDKKARELMIKANLRLVVKIAREYEGLGVPLLDLINEGNIGLMKAVERFDPKKGGKLSTYGSWWIKQSIRRALANQGKTIRLPVHTVDKIYHLRTTDLHLQEILGREPTEEEIAEELGITPKKLAALRTAAIRPISLDTPLGEEASECLCDTIPDEMAPDPAKTFGCRAEIAEMLKLIGNLPDREADILRLRFGLDEGTEKTLEQVGKQFGVTRERIRQIQNITLQKLRARMEGCYFKPPPRRKKRC